MQACVCELTSVICFEHQLVQFRRRVLVEIDLNPLGNRCSRAQYRLVHRASKRRATVPHSHPLSDPGALLWHETLFSYSPTRPAVMLLPPPDYSCTHAVIGCTTSKQEQMRWKKNGGREWKKTVQMKITINWKIKESEMFFFVIQNHYVLYEISIRPKFTQEKKYVVASDYARVQTCALCTSDTSTALKFTLCTYAIRKTTYGNDQNYNIKVFSRRKWKNVNALLAFVSHKPKYSMTHSEWNESDTILLCK